MEALVYKERERYLSLEKDLLDNNAKYDENLQELEEQHFQKEKQLAYFKV
jgi:hypothetical protein